jgi:hypothetical protein
LAAPVGVGYRGKRVDGNLEEKDGDTHELRTNNLALVPYKVIVNAQDLLKTQTKIVFHDKVKVADSDDLNSLDFVYFRRQYPVAVVDSLIKAGAFDGQDLLSSTTKFFCGFNESDGCYSINKKIYLLDIISFTEKKKIDLLSPNEEIDDPEVKDIISDTRASVFETLLNYSSYLITLFLVKVSPSLVNSQQTGIDHETIRKELKYVCDVLTDLKLEDSFRMEMLSSTFHCNFREFQTLVEYIKSFTIEDYFKKGYKEQVIKFFEFLSLIFKCMYFKYEYLNLTLPGEYPIFGEEFLGFGYEIYENQSLRGLTGEKQGKEISNLIDMYLTTEVQEKLRKSLNSHFELLTKKSW